MLDFIKPWVGFCLSMVIDVNGNHAGSDGTSHSISNEEDRTLLISLRRLADVIVTDSATAKAERYRASKLAPIEIWSRSSLPLDLEIGSSEESQPVTQVDSSDLAAQIERLTGLSVLLETGPRLTRLLSDSIGTVYLTVARGQDKRALAEQQLSALLGKGWQTEWFTTSVNGYLVAKRRGNAAN